MSSVIRHMVDHRFTSAHASEYLDGQLSPAGRDRVERHASACPKCRAMLASLRRMIAAMSAVGARPRPGIADGVLERLRFDG